MTTTIRKRVDPDGQLRIAVPCDGPGREVEVELNIKDVLTRDPEAEKAEAARHYEVIMGLYGSLKDTDFCEPDDAPARPAPEL